MSRIALRCDPCDRTLYVSLSLFERHKKLVCLYCLADLRWLP